MVSSRSPCFWAINCIIFGSTFALAIFPIQISQGQIETDTELKGNGFTLNYPAGWEVRNNTRTAENEIYLIFSDKPEKGDMTVGLGRLTQKDIDTFGLTPNSTKEEIDSKLTQIFPQLAKQVQSGFHKGVPSELEQIALNKYTIDGHKAGSAQFNIDYGNLMTRAIVVGTVIGNEGFIIFYKTPSSTFDENLPTIENVIKSIKIEENLDDTSSSNNEDNNDQSSNNNSNNPEDYDDLDELVKDIKNGDVDTEEISLSAFQDSGAYQAADQETQDCIDLAGKIGHNLGDQEIVNCSEDPRQSSR